MARFPDRRHDARVSPAAADVLVHRLDDGIVCRRGGRREQADRGHDHAGRAVAALHRFVFEERRLNRVQASVLLQRLDRDDGFSLEERRFRLARLHRLAIDEHRARAAVTFTAAVLGAGQVEVVPQHREQRLRRRDVYLMR